MNQQLVSLNRPYLTQDEVEKLLALAVNPRDKLWLRWLQRTGIRVTECLSLVVNDINFDRGLVTILHEKAKVKLSCLKCGARLAMSHTFCPKCGHAVEVERGEEVKKRRRTIPVDWQTLEETKQYLAGRSKGHLFELTRQRCHQIVRGLAAKVGLAYLLDFYTGKRSRLHCHHLRHSFAMHWITVNGREAESMQALQQHLGHQDIKTTYRYLHWLPAEMRKPYEKLWK